MHSARPAKNLHFRRLIQPPVRLFRAVRAEHMPKLCLTLLLGITAPTAALEMSQSLGEAGSLRIIGEADKATAEDTQVTLSGDARLIYGDVQMDAGQVLYEPDTGRAEANDGFRLLQPDYEIRGEQLLYDTKRRSGELVNGEFFLRDQEGRGSAADIRVKNGQELELEDVRYTSCPVGDNGWEISATEIDIDTEKGYGTADDVTLRFEGVPILFLPRFWFPAGADRQTGVLAPNVGNATQTGIKLGIPYYWNIADNYDATIEPRFYSKRGLQLSTEFRYLHFNDKGTVKFEYLPHDLIEGESRNVASWRHYTQFNPQTNLNINVAYASDRDYFDDFGSSLSVSSKVFLPQIINLAWQGEEWQAAANIEAYQTLDSSLAPSSRPYRRMPQLKLVGTESLGGNWHGTLTADWTAFHHSNLNNGQRLYLAPGVNWTSRTAGRTLKLATEWAYRRYAGNTGDSELGLPYVGADAGWTFVQDRNDGWLHTLSPRFAYRYRENKDQESLPIFDTRLAEFGFEEVFASNRFVGLDRLGDANQLGIGVVGRWQKHDVDIRLSLGEIFYFERPEVGIATGNNNRSDWLAEFSADWHPNWHTRVYLQTDEQISNIQQSTIQLDYKVTDRQRFSAAYRYQNEIAFDDLALGTDQLEQLDLSGVWPVGERWHIVGRWLQSIDSRRTLETLAGVEYQSCCWTLRLAGRRYVTDVNEYNSSFLVQLELNGLGSIGDGIEELLFDKR